MTDKALFAAKIIMTCAIIAGLCALATDGLACCAVVDVHADSRLNVRHGPDAEYKVSAGLADGAELHILQEQNGWALVAWPKYPAHPLGWVSADYLDKKMACALERIRPL